MLGYVLILFFIIMLLLTIHNGILFSMKHVWGSQNIVLWKFSMQLITQKPLFSPFTFRLEIMLSTYFIAEMNSILPNVWTKYRTDSRWFQTKIFYVNIKYNYLLDYLLANGNSATYFGFLSLDPVGSFQTISSSERLINSLYSTNDLETEQTSSYKSLNTHTAETLPFNFVSTLSALYTSKRNKPVIGIRKFNNFLTLKSRRYSSYHKFTILLTNTNCIILFVCVLLSRRARAFYFTVK